MKSKFKTFKFRNLKLAVKILKLINEGLYPSKIAKVLSVNPANITPYLRKMERLNWIHQYSKYPKLYEVTKQGEEILKKPQYVSDKHKIRLENYQIKIPIIKDNPKAKWDRINKDFRNWIPKYIDLDFPFKLTLKKTTENIIVYVKGKDYARDKSFFLNLGIFTSKVLNYVRDYLRFKKNIFIDVTKAEVIAQETANDIEEFDDEITPHTKYSVKLDRKAQSILGKTKQNSKAWIDRSEGLTELETNDLTYEENLILLPERVAKLDKTTDFIIQQQFMFAKNLEKHVEVLTQIGKSINKLDKTITMKWDKSTVKVKRKRKLQSKLQRRGYMRKWRKKHPNYYKNYMRHWRAKRKRK